MKVEIRKLTSELTEDYLQFFDKTPHATNKEEHKCYCIWWCNEDIEGKDYSTVEKRRELATKYIKGNNIQGYLAYYDKKVVGWCNSNTKAECFKCYCWRNYMKSVRKEENSPEIKVKSVFCFAIAPEMRRKGIAKLLLEIVCKDAKKETLTLSKHTQTKHSSMMQKTIWAQAYCLNKLALLSFIKLKTNLL